MSLVAKLPGGPGSLGARPVHRLIGTRRPVEVVCDLAVLVGACLTTGLVVGLGMMLAVLLLS
jgi:hypothetical protein